MTESESMKENQMSSTAKSNKSGTHSSRSVRVRFAPSPTGKLHVGGARTAIYNWAFARANNGTFILRIDDTDPTRSTEENTQIILRALRWLGLDWDEGPDVGGDFGPYMQTERLARYTQAAEELIAAGKAYYCFCSPETLEAERKRAHEAHEDFQGYNGACRAIDLEEAKRRVAAGEAHTIRLKVPKDRGDVCIEDAVHGRVVFKAKELDDFILIRSDGTPTYNFATVVDDADMHITHIIRGDDHLSNTPRQVIVYEALEAPTPIFAHISMILGEDGKKLSKRHGSTSVEEYQAVGYEAEAFVNYLALLGWSLDDKTTIIGRDILARDFSLAHVSKNPATFDSKKLLWINEQYLAALSDLEFAQKILEPQLVAAGKEEPGCVAAKPEWFSLLASVIKPRTKLAPEVVGLTNFLYLGDAPAIEEKAFNKMLAKESARPSLEAAHEALANLAESERPFITDAINEALAPLPEEVDVSRGVFYGAIRAALTGTLVSPPMGEMIELLGYRCTAARLEQALAKIS